MTFDPKLVGDVSAVAVAPDGKILVGGSLSSVGGQKSSQIARLLPGGQVDPGWSPASGKAVHSCAVLGDGSVIAGAWFPGHEGIARLLANGTSDPAFTASVEGGIQGIGVGRDGHLLLAGSFRTINGATRGGFGCIGIDGTLKASPRADTGVARTVSAVAPRLDGSIVLGGDFAALGGKDFDRLAKLAPTGLLDASFRPLSPEIPGNVSCLATQSNGTFLAGISFKEAVAGKTLYSSLLRFSANGVRDTSFAPVFTFGSEVPRVTSVVVQGDGKILVAGNFTAVNGIARQGIVRLFSDGTFDRSFTASLPGATGLALQADGKVLVSGTFTQVNGVARNHLARLNNDPVKEGVTIRQNQITWARDGTLPESDLVTFEVSPDGGVTWQTILPSFRRGTVWYASGFDLPVSGIVRARARVSSGILNGSSGLVEKVVHYALAPEIYVRERTGPDLNYLTDGQQGTIDFGEIPQGSPRLRTFEIYNGGNASLTVTGIQLPTGFTWLTPPELPASIPVSQYLTVSVRADATVLGGIGGMAHIASNDADEASFDFPLAGLVTGPDISVRAGGKLLQRDPVDTVFFGGSYQGGAPAQREFLISNLGTKDLVVHTITVPAGFANDPQPPFTVPPGGSRAILVTPDLSSPGWLAGELQILSSDADERLFRVRLAAAIMNPLVTDILKTRTKLNRATGYREQTLRITNPTTGATVPGFRIIIRGLPPGIEVRNASERLPDGSFVIEVLRPLGPLSHFDLLIEYDVPTGMSAKVSPQVASEVVFAAPATLAGVAVGQETALVIETSRRQGDGSYLIEFRAVPGRLYQVECSDDCRTWKAAEPTRAVGSRVRWIDRAAIGSDRGFYRVRELED